MLNPECSHLKAADYIYFAMIKQCGAYVYGVVTEKNWYRCLRCSRTVCRNRSEIKKPHKNMSLIKSLSIVTGFTMISRILGLVREMVTASKFAATEATDALFVAFRIPNLLRRLFAEGAFAQAFVPIITEYKEKEGEERAKLLISHVASLLSLTLLIVSILGVVGAPYLIYLIASGFSTSGGQLQLTTDLLRITFPYILFVSLTSLSTSVLNVWGKFAVPAVTPALLNLSFILFALFLTNHFDPPIIALAVGIFVGGLAQLMFQIPFLWRLGLSVKLRWNPRDPGILQILRRMGPAIFGVSAAQISLVINTNIASHFRVGSVSWLNYADRLMELPIGLLAVAMTTVVLPSLSRAVSTDNAEEYTSVLTWGTRLLLLVSIPSIVGLIILAEPIIVTLLMRGEFSEYDVAMTEVAFWGYGFGLIALIMIKLFASIFYANKDTKTPVKIALVALIFTQALNFVFWFLFPYEYRHGGLALAISGGAWLNLGLLTWMLVRKKLFVPYQRLLISVGRSVIGVLVMGSLLGLASKQVDWYLLPEWQRGSYLGFLVVAGALIYVVTLKSVGQSFADLLRVKR